MKGPVFSVVAMAAALLAIGAAPSTAASLSFRPAGSITATSLGKLTFAMGSLTIECNYTLTGRLATGPIAKTAGASVGEITEVTWAGCTGGEIETVLNLPWTVVYSSIDGTLPEAVSAVRLAIDGWSWELSTFGGFAGCLWSGNPEFSLALTRLAGAEYRSGLMRSLESALRLVSGFGCPSEGRYLGSFSLTSQTVTRT
ncbi:MAG TPA: hypothetical protein VFU94_13420 [Conexibacter sp.]|nr:hypothetical protein [Conexibacter sp.]